MQNPTTLVVGVSQGVENVFQSDQIKEKIKNVMLNKYGSEHFCTSMRQQLTLGQKKDPLKRKTAKENNLNWIEFFSMKEFENWYNNLER